MDCCVGNVGFVLGLIKVKIQVEHCSSKCTGDPAASAYPDLLEFVRSSSFQIPPALSGQGLWDWAQESRLSITEMGRSQGLGENSGKGLRQCPEIRCLQSIVGNMLESIKVTCFINNHLSDYSDPHVNPLFCMVVTCKVQALFLSCPLVLHCTQSQTSAVKNKSGWNSCS